MEIFLKSRKTADLFRAYNADYKKRNADHHYDTLNKIRSRLNKISAQEDNKHSEDRDYNKEYRVVDAEQVFRY